MNQVRQILSRTTKVFYVFLLLLGLVVTYEAYDINRPMVRKSYNYTVICDNGYTFDPLSKPIEKYFSVNEDGEELLHYRDEEIKAECEYHDIYYKEKAKNLPKNYKIEQATKNTQVITSKKDQLLRTIGCFVIYYIVLEILRRSTLYIFLGKNFFSLKS